MKMDLKGEMSFEEKRQIRPLMMELMLCQIKTQRVPVEQDTW
jgi:hypothetical protein